MSNFYMGPRDLNSEPYICAASAQINKYKSNKYPLLLWEFSPLSRPAGGIVCMQIQSSGTLAETLYISNKLLSMQM